jgi:hypothetical protein
MSPQEYLKLGLHGRTISALLVYRLPLVSDGCQPNTQNTFNLVFKEHVVLVV